MLPEKEFLALAECFSAAWSEMLSSPVHVTSLDAAATKGCCRMEQQMTCATESTIWELDRQLAAAVVDAQAGAEASGGERTHGPLTPLESALVSRAMQRLHHALNRGRDAGEWPAESQLGELGEPVSWSERDTASEDEPRAFPVRFQVRLLQTQGVLTWWLDPEHLSLLVDEAEHTQSLTAVLAEFDLPTSELEALSVGDVIATEQECDQPVLVFTDSGEEFRAMLGQAGPHKAIQRIDAAS